MKVCEISAVYKHKNGNKPCIKGAKDVFNLKDIIYPEGVSYRESFYVLPLNHGHRLLGKVKIADGGITECCADIRVIFQHLLLANATCFIAVHNHPSGALKPSVPDTRLTEMLRKAGDVMNIKIIDHIILTEESYYSFAEEGQL